MQRTKAISSRFYKSYKYGAAGLIFLLAFSYILYPLVAGDFSWFRVIISILYFGIGIKYWFPSLISSIKQMKDLSYDDENLYIIENSVEEQIPFNEIKEVEIVSLNGIYRFHFFDKSLHGGAVSCKTSMWYPFNFIKVDKELNRVRGLIWKAQREYGSRIGGNKGLPSQFSE